MFYSAALLLPVLLSSSVAQSSDASAVSSPSPFYTRNVAITYALLGSTRINMSWNDIYGNLTLAKPTALIPFLLNVGSPSQFDYEIRNITTGTGIVIVPAVGNPNTTDAMTQSDHDYSVEDTPPHGVVDSGSSKPPGGYTCPSEPSKCTCFNYSPYINSSLAKCIATQYRNYSSHIRLEGVQTYYNQGQNDAISNMIRFLTDTLLFDHILLNPWPIDKTTKKALKFSSPAVDGAYEQVLASSGSSTSASPIAKSTSSAWSPDFQKSQIILNSNPSVSILVNYEDPGQELQLAAVQKNSSEYANRAIKAMNTTVVDILDADAHLNPSGILYWSPPFDHNYNPVALGTWNFIVRQLKDGAYTGSRPPP